MRPSRHKAGSLQLTATAPRAPVGLISGCLRCQLSAHQARLQLRARTLGAGQGGFGALCAGAPVVQLGGGLAQLLAQCLHGRLVGACSEKGCRLDVRLPLWL